MAQASMTLRESMLQYIIANCPKEFYGKQNWLGVKMSPHMHWKFINKMTVDGIETNEGHYTWAECQQPVISTIYQRLKLMGA